MIDYSVLVEQAQQKCIKNESEEYFYGVFIFSNRLFYPIKKAKGVTMSNTINVNYMTRAYNQYQQKNAAKDQEKEDTRFADSVREKSEASGSIVGNYATSVTVHWVSGISYVNASCTTMTQMTLDYLVPFGIIVG